MQTQNTSVYIPVETPDNKTWATLLALLVHCGVIGFIIYTNHIQNLDGEAMETTIITPDELAAMQGQIQANQQAQASNNQTGLMTANNITQSPEAAKLNAELAQKQAQWQQQQDIIASQIDKEARQAQQEFANGIKQQQIEQETMLKELKHLQRNPINEPAPKSDAAPQSKIAISASNSPPSNSKPDTTTYDLGKEGKSNQPTGQAAGGQTGSSQSAGSNAGARANYKRLVEQIIEGNWTPPANTPVGTKVSARVSISDSGAVTIISVNSGDGALSETLRQAIQASSLPPPPTNTGADYGNSNMSFTVKPR